MQFSSIQCFGNQYSSERTMPCEQKYPMLSNKFNGSAQIFPNLLLRFLVRRISFLYLCFFIFSFLCLFTLISIMLPCSISRLLCLKSSHFLPLTHIRCKKGCST